MINELKIQLRKLYNAVATQHGSNQTSQKGYQKAEKDETDSCNWIIDEYQKLIDENDKLKKEVEELENEKSALCNNVRITTGQYYKLVEENKILKEKFDELEYEF